MQDSGVACTDSGCVWVVGVGGGRRAGQAEASPTSDKLRWRLDLRHAFSGFQLCRVKLRWAGRCNPSCALAPGFGWGAMVCSRALGPNPPKRFSQQRALIWWGEGGRQLALIKKTNKTPLWNTEKERGSTFYCIISNNLHTGWHLPKSPWLYMRLWWESWDLRCLSCENLGQPP